MNPTTAKSHPTRLLVELAKLAGIWTAADAGFYFLLPLLGVEPSYNASPVAVSGYFAAWWLLAGAVFRKTYAEWSYYARWPAFERHVASYIAWLTALVLPLVFVLLVLPALPDAGWMQAWTPPEIRLAKASYFLPKAADIVFQQLLIVALVVSLAAHIRSRANVTALSASFFGGAHVLLLFGDVPLGYALRYMVAGALFGLLFPHLVLRVRGGLAYSYLVQWAFYATTAVMPHVFAAYGK